MFIALIEILSASDRRECDIRLGRVHRDLGQRQQRVGPRPLGIVCLFSEMNRASYEPESQVVDPEAVERRAEVPRIRRLSGIESHRAYVQREDSLEAIVSEKALHRPCLWPLARLEDLDDQGVGLRNQSPCVLAGIKWLVARACGGTAASAASRATQSGHQREAAVAPPRGA